jgi:hypothetical protein
MLSLTMMPSRAHDTLRDRRHSGRLLREREGQSMEREGTDEEADEELEGRDEESSDIR